ncbi:MAG: sigma-54-dependent Fis family transcriptional regulator [Planctomycetota bacterium]
MSFHVEITDAAGFREQPVEQPSFWVGALRSGCEVELELPGTAGRVLEVQLEPDGGLQVRAEPGLTFPVRSVTGNVGRRFERLLDGDVLNVGPALLKVRVANPATAGPEELDPGSLTLASPGSPVGAWYDTYMEVADTLEGLNEAERMIAAAMEGILASTGADRVYLKLTERHAVAGQDEFFINHAGDRSSFGVSQSLVEQVWETGRVVHVPVASADPVASRFVSVRREGISSGIAIPIRALGKTMGVLYADCVRDGAVLTAEDLQRVAFIGRMLAGALGNRVLVSSLVKAEPAAQAAGHPALQSASPACATMIERVRLYAPTDYTVLIRGETGAGKEVLAHALHDLSRRASGPFVPVNCAAIPEQLMESMLFGHEKGAFTGAMASSRGHFEEAESGTIFLDEIGDMALQLQAKILRVLQDRTITPVGSRKSRRVDVRVLAATHQDLEHMVANGTFREDLYFRIRELEIVLPPLRERREDVLMLCNRFLAEAAEELGYSEIPELAADTLDFLNRHQWRGNIRELRHVIKGAALRATGGPITMDHLDLGPILSGGDSVELSSAATWKERLELQEQAALKETFERAGGNLTKAAELFGVPRTTYREKLVKSGLLKTTSKDE